jgi:hypothetical protein
MRRYAALALAATFFALTACADSSNPVAPGTSSGLRPHFLVVPVPGQIFTTDNTCTGVNINIYSSKDDVWLDGGPNSPGAAGLPDGEYYVKVTEPDGTLLGTSLGTADETPVVVSGGEFAACVQLSAILKKASDGSPGYDDTANPGGEYKVWASKVSTFDDDGTKTDNFKAIADGGADHPELHIQKFYDANANGIDDAGDSPITGWRIRIQDNIDYIRFTPVDIIVAADDYTVTESDPIGFGTTWFHTTANPVVVTLADGDETTVKFGNVCVGAGGGLTLGFWSNRNGAKIIAGPPNLLAGVLALTLRKANGTLLGVVSLANFQKFLLDATATNMANMLSAQLAAMYLNVASGGVNGNAMIYAPGTNSANSLGFATVNAVMAEANTLLGSANPLLILTGSPDRPRAEALKNALNNGNNNLNFVQPTPCAFSFAE